jgi:hypothetical protein
MNAREHAFYLKVARALGGCQAVEQELKLYLTEAFQLARKCIGPRMVFKLSGEDFADAPLERLIRTFRQLTDDTALVQALSAFKNERNFLSHRAITHCTDLENELSYPDIDSLDGRLEAIQKEADRLVACIHEEANKFRGYLYFEEEKG